MVLTARCVRMISSVESNGIKNKPGIVVHTFNLSILEAEAVGEQSGLAYSLFCSHSYIKQKQEGKGDTLYC